MSGRRETDAIFSASIQRLKPEWIHWAASCISREQHQANFKVGRPSPVARRLLLGTACNEGQDGSRHRLQQAIVVLPPMDILGRLSKAIGASPAASAPKAQPGIASSSTRSPASVSAPSSGRRRAEARSESARGVAAFKDNWRAIQVGKGILIMSLRDWS